MPERIKLLFMLILLLNFGNFLFSQEPRVIEIAAQQFSYTPNIIKLKKGETVLLRLKSKDVTHGFFLDGYGIEFYVHPGEVREVPLKATRTGRFTFRCSVTCGMHHPYMVGYLYVSPNYLFYGGISSIFLLGLGSIIFMYKKKENNPKLLGIFPYTWKFELTKFKIVRNLFKSRWFPFIGILINLFIFAVIVLATFFGGKGAGNYNFGIMIVWILWWVLLMLFMVPFIGRFWCMVCPFPIFGDWFQRGRLISVVREKLRGLNIKWPRKWKNVWPLVILFWVATWFSGFFTVMPIASFILLSIIFILATVMAIIFEKRTFCLTTCPVSGFQGLYANFSLCEVRVKDPEICKKHTPKTCYVGNEKGYGCPWMEIPYDMNQNTYCGLCLECFKTCPYDNMAFNIRPFGKDLFEPKKRTDQVHNRRSTDEAFKALTMIGIFAAFFLPFQGPYGFLRDMMRAKTLNGFFLYIAGSFLISFIIIPGIHLLFSYLSKTFSSNNEIKLKELFVNFSYCLVPIGLAVWIGFSLGIILPNGSYILHILSDPFAWGWNLFGTANYPWTPILTDLMPYFQSLIVLIGFIFALDIGSKLCFKLYSKKSEVQKAWIPIALYLMLLNIVFLKLFTG